MFRTYLAILILVTCLSSETLAAGDNPDFVYLEPEGVPLPRASFGLGVVIEPGYRLAFLTGRTGANPDGSYSADFEIQARIAMASVGVLLAEAGMGWMDVASINVYLTDRADIPLWSRIRNEVIGASRPAGTGVIVKGLAAPGARLEVQVIGAQKAD